MTRMQNVLMENVNVKMVTKEMGKYVKVRTSHNNGEDNQSGDNPNQELIPIHHRKRECASSFTHSLFSSHMSF